MNDILTDQQKQDFLNRGFSRRTLGRIAAVIAGGAVLPFYNEPAMAQLSAVRKCRRRGEDQRQREPAGTVPEARGGNPRGGPKDGGRYMYEETFTMQETWPSRRV